MVERRFTSTSPSNRHASARPGGGSSSRRTTDNRTPEQRSADARRNDRPAEVRFTEPVYAGPSGFDGFGLPQRIVSALGDSGILEPFPIQKATLPDAMAGKDILGRGRTGSGKTLGFVLPILARLATSGTPRNAGRPRALILAPTRELASQINATVAPLAAILGMRSTVIFGGVGAGGQVSALRNGVDILVACPGRLEDHMRSNACNLRSVEITVLDEADHMADLGFLPAVKRLLDETPRESQRMLFSATLDAAVDVIVKRYLRNPITHSVDSEQSPVVEMAHHVLHVSNADRLPVLVDLTSAPGRTLIFTRTKFRAKTLTRQLNMAGVPSVELHGNLAQNARERNLAAFSDGTAPTMVATDIAARGIHVDDLSLVIHADPPVEHKAYLHRSGRTAHAGNAGTVVTLMTDEQVKDVRDLTRKAGIKPTTTIVHPKHPLLAQLAPGMRTLAPSRGAPVTAADAARATAGARDSRPASNGGGRGRGPRSESSNRGGASAAPRHGNSGGGVRTGSGANGSGTRSAGSGGAGRGSGSGGGSGSAFRGNGLGSGGTGARPSGGAPGSGRRNPR